MPVRLGGGVTNFPLSRIRSVQRLGLTQIVVPGYGEPLRGRVEWAVLPMETALGPVQLPWNQVEELQVQGTTASELTWLSPPSAPGIALSRDGEISLEGGAVWTREIFGMPVAVEFEMFLERRQTGGGWLDVELMGTPRSKSWQALELLSSTPTKITTDRPTGARFLYNQLTPTGYKDGLALRQTHTAFHSIRQQPDQPFYVTAGVWQRVRLEVVGDWTRVEWNGRRYELRGVQIPQATARLRFSTDDTPSRWRVRNVVVRR
jgi:hypothetical protein